MDANKIEKLSRFLSDSTLIELREAVEDIAEKSPQLLVNYIEISEREKAIAYIDICIKRLGDTAKNESPAYAVGYVEGLIDFAFIGGSISNNTKEKIASEFTEKLKELKMEDI